jgi:hypothetical protein
MDPVTVILSALAVAGAKVGDQVIKDGYAALKALIVRKFGPSEPKLEERIDDYVADQETFEKPAAKALRDSGAVEDQDIVDHAAALLRAAEAAQPGVTTGLVNQITNARNVVVANRIDGGVRQN